MAEGDGILEGSATLVGSIDDTGRDETAAGVLLVSIGCTFRFL